MALTKSRKSSGVFLHEKLWPMCSSKDSMVHAGWHTENTSMLSCRHAPKMDESES